MNLELLISRVEPHQLRQLDVQFSAFLKELDGADENLALAGFLVSYELGKGNVCLDFNKPHELLNKQELEDLLSSIQLNPLVQSISSGQLYSQLQSQSTSQASSNIRETPLILDEGSLYLQRYYEYEQGLSNEIQSRLLESPLEILAFSEPVQSLFPVSPSSAEINWQAAAVCLALKNKFSVISGGPGTGKTTTVIRLLALMIQRYALEYDRAPIIKLAAPTGKAAMRLTESITNAKAQLEVNDDVKQLIPQKAETLHRLLQRNTRGEFKFNEFNPMHLDVLIVDEASMVDLPLMAKLMKAVPEHGQIVLLGDKDQLASVEAGSVLADICDNEVEHGYSPALIKSLQSMIGGDYTNVIEEHGALIRNHICELRKSYRFDENSGIGFLAKAANAGNYTDWNNVVYGRSENPFPDLDIRKLDDSAYATTMDEASNIIVDNLAAIHQQGVSDDAALDIHENYGRFQILCALKDGPLGVKGINEEVEKRLKSKGYLSDVSKWYSGKPIIILENDYGLNLYNGDIGIVLPSRDINGDVRLKACFIAADKKVRWIQPSRLPKHDTVYAMTVHKSQGSEFEHCLFILPNYTVPILTKELIYTGITRAKKRLTLLLDDNTLKTALKKKVQRASGLGRLLWRNSLVDNNTRQSNNNIKLDSESKPNAESSTQVDDGNSQFSLF